MLAVKNSFGNLVQYLVIRGADLNITDNSGKTVLHTSAIKQDYASINFLLDNGARMNTLDKDGKKPLDYLPDDKRASIIISRLSTAAELDQALLDFTVGNSYVGVSLVLAKGAHVDTCDNNGDTPLLIAARAHNQRIVTLLLSHGANPLKVDKSGMLAMDYAVKQKDAALAQLIETYTIKYELEHGVSRPKNHVHHHTMHAAPQHHTHKHIQPVAKECDDTPDLLKSFSGFFDDVTESISTTFSEMRAEPIEAKPLPKLKSDTAFPYNAPKNILPVELLE